MRRTAFFATATALLVALAALPASAGSGDPRQSIIVVLHADAGEPAAVAAEMAARHNGRGGFVYQHALSGFSLEVPAQAVAAIARDRRVSSVEYDQVASTFAQETPTGIRRAFAADNPNLDIDGRDDLRVDVDVAVIDTGIDTDHPDLNVVGGTNCVGSRFSSSCSGSVGEDANGHGTHVAGSIGALDNTSGVVGMAPGARLHAVRVLDSRGNGQLSWIVAGIDWVTARASTIEVANMSLGCECTSSAMNTAITNSVAAGVTYVVAAGNNDKNASTFSPANHSAVITVSALSDFNGLPGGGAAATCRADQDDTLADFSNWGATVEIAAPGVCITSTWLNGGYHTISGTSMASPHVAGAAALLASGASTLTAAQVRSALVGAGNVNWTDDSGDGVKEPLLDVTGFAAATTGADIDDDGGGEPENTPPVAAFTPNCTNLSCTFDASASTDDAGITSYAWDFGDSSAGAGEVVVHDYALGNTYMVTLTVTDGDGLTDSDSQEVTVEAAPPAGTFTLSASGFKVKGVQQANLSWTGATGAVDVYRDDAKITTVDGATHTDNIGNKGGGSYTYRVCEAGTETCSNDVTVSF